MLNLPGQPCYMVVKSLLPGTQVVVLPSTVVPIFSMSIDEVTTENANFVVILTTIFGDEDVVQSTDSTYEGQRKAKLFPNKRKCV